MGHIKQKAETILKIQKERELSVEDINLINRQTKSGSNKTKSRAKMNKKELKQKQKEDISSIITELVNDIHDFGAGFHQPRIYDMLLIKLLICSIKFIKKVI